jgi:hypothetical protein
MATPRESQVGYSPRLYNNPDEYVYTGPTTFYSALTPGSFALDVQLRCRLRGTATTTPLPTRCVRVGWKIAQIHEGLFIFSPHPQCLLLRLLPMEVAR